jgi:beta-1,4-N-acetylglucosaminyltransferase
MLITYLSNLPAALDQAEALREKIKSRPPPNSGVHRQGTGLEAVLDEEMGIEIAGHIE